MEIQRFKRQLIIEKIKLAQARLRVKEKRKLREYFSEFKYYKNDFIKDVNEKNIWDKPYKSWLENSQPKKYR